MILSLPKQFAALQARSRMLISRRHGTRAAPWAIEGRAEDVIPSPLASSNGPDSILMVLYTCKVKHHGGCI